jgi:hypothetical protein
VAAAGADLGQLFAEALRRARPAAGVDDLGYSAFADCLVEGVDADAVRACFATADMPDGDSQPILYEAGSPIMMAVNSFAPWLADLGALEISGIGGFRDLRFEAPLPAIGDEPAATLAALLISPDRLIAVESAGAAYLSVLREDCIAGAESGNGDGWRRERLALAEGERSYARLDAARLLNRHAGLELLLDAARGGRAKPVPATLLYLYWEPVNAARFDEFAEHRAEIEDFGQAVAGGQIGFAAMSYLDLWTSWAGESAPPWLAMHLARLHQHYSFRI